MYFEKLEEENKKQRESIDKMLGIIIYFVSLIVWTVILVGACILWEDRSNPIYGLLVSSIHTINKRSYIIYLTSIQKYFLFHKLYIYRVNGGN